MKTKILIILTIGFFARFLLSCAGMCDSVKYYNFTKVELVNINQNIVENDSLKLYINPLDYECIAFNKNNISNSAFAIDCDDGWGGMKYPITKIEFISNADFNNDFPANTILNNLITINAWIDDVGYKYMKLDEYDLSETIWSDIYITSYPTIDKKHIFTVKIIKINGDTIIANSEEIIWQ